MKTLILYVFHRINDNVVNFIEYAVFESKKYHFVIISNATDNNIDSLNIPSYVTVIIRDNIGFDFGGWSVGLLENDRYKSYDNFLFLNASVVGPFIPPYFNQPWPDLVTFGLKGDIKIYGGTINNYNEYGHYVPGKSHHVQSFSFALDRVGLDVYFDKEIFSLTKFNDSHLSTIINCEVGGSRAILEAGYNIGCNMKRYEGTDFRFPERYNRDHYAADCMYDASYSSFFLHPYETIFIKSNRNINPIRYKHYLLTKRVSYPEDDSDSEEEEEKEIISYSGDEEIVKNS